MAHEKEKELLEKYVQYLYDNDEFGQISNIDFWTTIAIFLSTLPEEKEENEKEKYKEALNKIANGTQPYNEREAFIFVDIAKQIANEVLSDFNPSK